MAYDVNVKIDLTKPVGTAGFGIPLILVENAGAAITYAEVSDVAEAATAGFEAGTDAYKAAQLMFAQKNSPKKIALCAVTGTAETALADKTLTGKEWRQLIVINGDDEENATAISAIATAVEALEHKMYFANLDTDDNTTISVTDLNRTVLFYCDATEEVPVPVAALVGEAAARTAGSFTYKNLILKGIEPQELTDSEIDAIHAKGGITFVTKAGDNVTSEGKVAGGEYIDIVDSIDYIVQQIAYRTQKVLNNNDKVYFDNRGIAMLENPTVDVLQTAYNNGIIAETDDGSPDFSVTFAAREETTEADRANRHYKGASFRFAPAGAVHLVDVNGEITV